MISFEFDTGQHGSITASLRNGEICTSEGLVEEVTPEQEALLRTIATEQNIPFLATELRRLNRGVLDKKDISIHDVFSEVQGIFERTGMGESLLKIGKDKAGKSTHYAMLSSSDDAARLEFAHAGLEKIRKRKASPIQRRRQEAPFLTFIKSIEDPEGVEIEEDSKEKRKLLVYGSAITALTLGTASTVYMILKSRD